MKQPRPWHQDTWNMLDTIVQINTRVCVVLGRHYTCQLLAIEQSLVLLYREFAQAEGK